MDHLTFEQLLLEGPVLSPRKEDILFRGGIPDWQHNACVNPTWGNNEHGYTEGYRRGAMRLVEHVIENQREQDYLVYPIIFLYRHHIELALKNIIRHTPYILDRPLTKAEIRRLDRHRLDELWQDLKPMFADVCKAAGWDKLDAEDEEGVESYIRQLTALDPDSSSFRYTHTRKGDPSLPPELKTINLRHFAELVERLATYLDALDTAVGVLEDRKMETEAEWRNDMAS